ERARKAQKKEEINVEQGELKAAPTKFVGYDFLESEAIVETVLPGKKADELNVVVDRTPLYAEMGGQVGDRGLLHVPGHDWTDVGPDKLTFDFSSAALTKQEVRDVQKLVNEKIGENAPVSWTEIPYAEAKKRSDIQQFFRDKYGDVVRVVQIGGEAKELNGYS